MTRSWAKYIFIQIVWSYDPNMTTYLSLQDPKTQIGDPGPKIIIFIVKAWHLIWLASTDKYCKNSDSTSCELVDLLFSQFLPPYIIWQFGQCLPISDNFWCSNVLHLKIKVLNLFLYPIQHVGTHRLRTTSLPHSCDLMTYGSITVYPFS